MDDLCLDYTQNLSDLTTNGGDDHRYLVKEITSITCASQVRVPGIRSGEIAGRGVRTRARLGDGEVVKVEVGIAFRTAWGRGTV